MIIDIKDFGTRTPDQVIRVFFAEYTPEAIETALMDIFILCAQTKEKENPGTRPLLTDIASLFDQVIAFTRAIHELREDNCRCPACGKSQTNDSG
ncbi:hypothetical protein [Mucilaginibacter sp. L3T2-6]|uniref:hypothetical protein n=1 Tax=Mucilaginibacter sp. L3T2-6 TaxID=3062491 RepID=UPI002674A27E|nr:hypothetical protein [Mucilaginibacter sp. L3T2-6]MDO3641258.1 hypothetical protein [Mucilaginibacter sp. L3T2-6]MDV6213982.1 hypothetical protein [Mucilaginibacter sp. L3T2-6]